MTSHAMIVQKVCYISIINPAPFLISLAISIKVCLHASYFLDKPRIVSADFRETFDVLETEPEISKLWHTILYVTNLWSCNKKNSILKFTDWDAPLSNKKIPLKSHSISRHVGIKAMKTRHL